MADFVTSLVDMGFDRVKAEKAVQATGNIGVEPALDWIYNNPDDSAPTPATDSSAAPETMEVEATLDSNEPVDSVVRSYKCEDCGKILKDETEMEYHAAKTQHTNFSESTEEKKALTAEEKTEQLKRIEQKIKEKRIEREAKEKIEALDREKQRIKSGKDLLEAKKRIQEQQMKEIVDARRREKNEEKNARDRVRAQIEADKAARRTKEANEKGLPPPPSSPVEPIRSSSLLQSASGEKKDYKETKLQLRLPSGKSLVHSFGVQEPLAAVRLFVELNRDDGVTGTFNLMSTFPRKVYEDDEYNMPLEALGLVPSAVLMVTRVVAA